AFEGWNDAAEAASTAGRYLATRSNARRFASLDVEEFYDFTVARPHVRLEPDGSRRIEWPEPSFEAGHLNPRDIINFAAVEPSFRWKTFSANVLSVAQELGAEMVITLGALMADVPHTRPIRVTGTAADATLAEQLGLIRSRYEGPTGIVGVIHDTFARAGIASVSLWATIPHYLSQIAPSPHGAMALVDRAADLLGCQVDLTELQIAGAAYERQVAGMVEADDDLAEYVRRLEAERDDVEPSQPAFELPDREDLAAQVERFLREQRDD
ncbi:MAG: PAC2 family protein, partial [Acidimicrobiales bacterium]